LLLDDDLLEMSHDGLAVLDREADLASRQALHILVDRQFRTMGRPNSSVPSNTIFHRIDAFQEESASCSETP
jgi:hypothetical protein